MVANKIAFIGRVVRNLELQSASKGTGKNKIEWSYAYGTIAVRKNKDDTWFIPFKAVDKVAETLAEFAPKGTLIAVEGHVEMYKPKDEEYEQVQLVVTACQLLSNKKSDDKE